MHQVLIQAHAKEVITVLLDPSSRILVYASQVLTVLQEVQYLNHVLKANILLVWELHQKVIVFLAHLAKFVHQKVNWDQVHHVQLVIIALKVSMNQTLCHLNVLLGMNALQAQYTLNLASLAFTKI
jgi:hypothetical protein